MAKKAKKSKKGRKKHRSAAQKAATRKMLAANRRKRHGHGGGKRKAHKRKRRGRPAGAHPVPAKRRTRAKSRRHHRWHKVKAGKRAKSHFRRTNPALPLWGQVVVGAAAGVGVAAGVQVVARKVSPAKAAMISDLAALALIGVGVHVAKKRPLLGASIASGAAAAALVPQLAAKVEAMTAPAGSSAQQVAETRLQGLQYLHGMHPAAPQFPAAALSHADAHADLSAVAADMGAVAAQLGALGYDPY